jgi:hypothetical protein
MNLAMEMGIDGVLTNCPETMIGVLGHRPAGDR